MNAVMTFVRRMAAPLATLSLAFVMTLAGQAVLAQGKEAAPAAADPALEKQVLEITAELRCLVCQNQTIADSHAELAVDLRNQVREMIRKGQSKEQILTYMTDRYGDFVLYRPPLKQTTMLLWFGPALLLLAAVIGLVVVLRRRAKLPDDQFEPEDDDALVAADGATPAERALRNPIR